MASFPTLKASSQDALLLAILDSIGKDDLTMAELVLRIQDVLAAKEFQGELKGNLQATTENRLQHLITGLVGQIFDSQLEIPKMSDLLNGYSIFEFDGLSEQDIGLIIHAHLNLLRREIARISGDDKPIRLVIIVDEAHIIVPDNNGFHSSEDSVDTLEASTKVIIRALAELRKHGVSVILADQSPSRVSRDVVRLVGSLVAMKTTDREDREILGSSMNFSDFEFQDILNLKTGEAYLSTPGLIRPRKFRTSPPHAELHGRLQTDGQLIEMLKGDPSLERNRKKKLAETVRKFETGLNKLETDLSQEYGKIAKAKERVEKGINAGRLEASLVCETALQLRRCRSEISSLLTRFKKVFFFVLTERYSKDRNEKQLLKLERLRSRFRDDVDKVATHSMRLLSDLATRYDELIK
ncbi:MAG: ATP-binding protein [Candidatus Omnitrophica bacterium]|nr:ATP-binding protein [Candidatus Omnitrophota bacterium]